MKLVAVADEVLLLRFKVPSFERILEDGRDDTLLPLRNPLKTFITIGYRLLDRGEPKEVWLLPFDNILEGLRLALLHSCSPLHLRLFIELPVDASILAGPFEIPLFFLPAPFPIALLIPLP